MGPALRAGGRKSHTGSNPVLATKLVDLSKPHRQDIGDLKGSQDKMLWEHGTNPGQTVTTALTVPSSSLGRIWGARYLVSWSNWLGHTPLKRVIRVRFPMIPPNEIKSAWPNG